MLCYAILYYTSPAAPAAASSASWRYSIAFIGKHRDPLIRDPLIVSLLSLIEAILSLTDYYISLLSLIKSY